MVFFVFKQKTAYEMRIRDWSSDVCSSDLPGTPDRLRYNYWMHYAEGSLMPLLVMKLILSRVEPGTPALLRPLARQIVGGRSEERRVGQEGVSSGRTRWWQEHYKINKPHAINNLSINLKQRANKKDN